MKKVILIAVILIPLAVKYTIEKLGLRNTGYNTWVEK